MDSEKCEVDHDLVGGETDRGRDRQTRWNEGSVIVIPSSDGFYLLLLLLNSLLLTSSLMSKFIARMAKNAKFITL